MKTKASFLENYDEEAVLCNESKHGWVGELCLLFLFVYLVECNGCGLTRHFIGANDTPAVESVEVVE